MPDQKEISTFGPTIVPPKAAKPGSEPYFIIGADDKPLDTRIIAVSIGVRAELKVGDRTFSAPISLHEVIVLRHFYEARAGSGQVRITGAWVPGMNRQKQLTHSDLMAETKRMQETYVVAKTGGTIIKSFELYFGSEPTAQLKRLHVVMREQYEAWNALFAKAMGRLPADAALLNPKLRESMASELITEREIEEIALKSDPSRAGLEMIELAEVKLADISKIPVATAPAAVAAPPAVSAPPAVAAPSAVDAIKAQVDAMADEPLSRGEKVAAKIIAAGHDSHRANAVAALIEDFGDRIPEEMLVKACGSKTKAEQIKPLLTG